MEKDILATVNDYYDNFMFGGRQLNIDKIGFFNLGYWKGIEDSVELAQINLIETLADFLSKGGNVLDVACGKGASTKFLTKYFDSKKITGINISERQLEICRILAPECDFRLMDATKLEFGDSSFDNMLCIEAAPHFSTRYKFFEEAHRVLKPGGRLAMSDILFDLSSLGLAGGAHPKENYLSDLNAYRESLSRVGFSYVRVEDSTKVYFDGWLNFEIRRMERQAGKEEDYKALAGMLKVKECCLACCLVYIIK